MIDFKKIFADSEKVNVEVKAAQGGIPNSIWETYSSFANTFGGTIILGIGEKKETKKFIPVGVADPNKMVSDVWNTVNNAQKVNVNILLERHVYTQSYDGKDYVVIEVPRANRQDKPVYVGTDMFKGTFRRNHEGDYHCTKAEIKAMLRDQADTTSDALVLENVSLDVLNGDSIKSYRNRFELIRQGHTWNSLPNDEFLMKIGAAKISEIDGKVHPTLGGLIFFGNFINIMDELPDFFLDYREKLSTETRWSDRVCSGDGDWSGNVYDFYFKIIDRLTSDVKKPFAINADLLRDDDTPIHKSIREALANALIHADYYGRQGIVIEKEFRKLKLSNPGTFRISVDDAISGGISDARNGRIFNMFSLIKVGERSGMGLCDLYTNWKNSGYEKPVIEESIEPDRITLTLQIEIEKANVTNVANDVANVVNNVVNVANINGVTETDKKVYAYIASHKNATTKEISTALGLNVRTVQRSVKELEKYGFVKKSGTRNNIEWIILK